MSLIIQKSNTTQFTEEAQSRQKERLNTLQEHYRDLPPDTFLNNLVDRIVAINRYVDILRVRKWRKNFEFYVGNHYGHVDHDTGAYVIDDILPDDHLYANNQYGYSLRSISAQWTRANTVIEFKPRQDDPQIVGAAKVASKVMSEWFGRRWKATQRQIEAKYAMLTGNYIRDHYWIKDSGVHAWVPKTEQIKIAGEEEGYQCTECGLVGSLNPESQGSFTLSGIATGNARPPLDEFGQCPGCGSGNILEFGLPEMTVGVVTGQEQVDGGDAMIEPCDPMEFSLYPHAQEFEFSPYMTRERMFMAEILQHYYPEADIPYGMESNYKLIMQRALQVSPGNQNYSWRNDGAFEGMATLQEVWIHPMLYSWYVTPEKDRQTGEIQEDARMRYAEKYPKGMCIARIGNNIVDRYGADKIDRFAHGRFDIVPNTVYGRGCDDSVSENEQLNRMENLWHDILVNHASRLTTYNPLRIDPNEITGSPDDLIGLKNAQPDEKPGDFIHQAQPAGATPDLPAFIAQKMDNMNKMNATFPAMNGDSEGRAETATRSMILRDQSTSLHGPALELKAETDVRSNIIGIKLFQANWVGRRFYYTKGQYDDYEAEYFEKSHIEGDFEVTAKPGSHVPRSDGEKRAATIEAGQWGQLPMGVWNPQVPPQLRAFLLAEYGLSYELDDVAPDYRKQSLEIRRLEDILADTLSSFESRGIQLMLPPGTIMPDGIELLAEEANPLVVMFLAAKIPVDEFESHGTHVECVKKYLLSDKGIKAHPVLHSALKYHIKQHFDGQVKMKNYLDGLTIQANQTQIMATAALSGAPNEGGGAPSSSPDSGKETAPPSQANQPTTRDMEAALPTR